MVIVGVVISELLVILIISSTLIAISHVFYLVFILHFLHVFAGRMDALVATQPAVKELSHNIDLTACFLTRE